MCQKKIQIKKKILFLIIFNPCQFWIVSLDLKKTVDADAQQPGAAVIPWERMASELDSRGHARPGTHFRGTDTHN